MPRGAATCRRNRRHTACCHKDYFTTSCQSRLAFPLSLIIWKSKFRAFLNSGLSEPAWGRGVGGLAGPPYFGRSVNTIWIRVADYAHHVPPPWIFKPSYGPVLAAPSFDKSNILGTRLSCSSFLCATAFFLLFLFFFFFMLVLFVVWHPTHDPP